MVQLALFASIYLACVPPMLLCVGAARKVWACSRRIARLQLEGAALVMAGLLLRLLAFDPFFGLDSARESRFGFWFDRGEQGMLAIGIILFGLGFFLERRPRPGLDPWPARYTRAAAGCLGACVLVALVFLWRGYAPGPMPWTLARTWFLLGLAVFAAVYCRMAFLRPAEAARAESDLIEIED